MRHGILRSLIFLVSMCGLYFLSAVTARADARIYTDRAAFIAASQSLESVDFEDQPLSWGSGTIVVHGVTFGSAGPIGIDNFNSNRVLRGGTVGEFTYVQVTPPSGTTAIGFEQYSSPLNLFVSGGGEFHYTHTGYTFVGFTSATPFDYLILSYYVLGGSPDVIIDNLLFGQRGPVAQPPALFDFDGDLKADISIWRQPQGTWYIRNSSNSSVNVFGWGIPTDIAVPGDYDGDGKTDIAVWRPSSGVWYIFNSSNSLVSTRSWGLSGDIPAPADYDLDGKTDMAVFRPSETRFYVVRSSDGTPKITIWGSGGEVPVPGDYDGDGTLDIAVWRPSTGQWHIRMSSTRTAFDRYWGLSGDRAVPGDYDGDGKTDLACWRPSSGVWYILNSSDGSVTATSWGIVSGDVPVPADYDGDRKTDIAIWRPSQGTWYIINSSDASIRVVGWGVNGDLAVPSAYVR